MHYIGTISNGSLFLVKAWGNPKDTPVLAFHGVRDNAGTFDRLIEHLPSSFYYICIDLPGHGKSAHFPPYLPVHTINYIIVYKVVVNYFKNKQYIILGHSYGAQIGLLFTQLYPQYVLKLIMLDAVYLIPQFPNHFKSFITEQLEEHDRILNKVANGVPPSYTYEEALNRISESRYDVAIPLEAALPLFKRMAVETSNGKYQFTSDQRLKTFINPQFSMKYIVEFLKASPVTCPVLIILASESWLFFRPFSNVIKELKKNKQCRVVKVEGNHDVHNVYPERVAPTIRTFLLSNKSKL